jgi:hypothetical protein
MCRPDEGRKMIARGRLSPTKEESGSLKGAPMSRRAERPRGLAVATPTASKPAIWCVLTKRGRFGSGQRGKRPEGRGSQRAASVCRWPGAQHHVYAAERSVRWFYGRGAGRIAQGPAV